MNLLIYGASDDLIEVEGDIREEFTYDNEGQSLLAFSDGTVLTIDYSVYGVWRISPWFRGTSTLDIVQAPIDDEDNYSDRATLYGAELKWVVYGSDIAYRKENK